MRLVASGIAVRYGRHAALRGISLAAEPGEVLVVLGANGSGKSTLLRSLAGQQKHSGTAHWSGPAAAIGFMPQDSTARPLLTVFETVLLGRLRSLALRVGPGDLAAAAAALAETGIADLAPRMLATLSGGQRQLAFLAQTLAGAPQALLLDEPTSALDIAHQLHVLALLRETTRRRGLTTIAVLHDINAAARFADRIAILAAGTLRAIGTARDVLTQEILRDCYGVEVAIQPGPDGRPVVIALEPARPSVPPAHAL
jgi:iron complex transport system ATP-binding protein